MNTNKYTIKLILFFIFTLFTFFNFSFINANSKANNSITLYCNNNLLMEVETGNVLFEKNGYSKIYPASTTKILTTILVLDNLSLDENIVASKTAIDSTPIDSSIMGIKKGEVFSVENLLYGLLLPSGNDAAIVLAEAVSENVDDFVNLMNEKAKEIGCQSTHFVNPHGFYNENHYSTPYDMALILRYAMNYDEFRKIIETRTWELPPTNKTETSRILKNTNRLLDENYSVFYQYAMGGKTGYTIESRGTYVGYAKKDDKLIIISNFDGSQNINGQNARFLDAITLSDYAFDNFSKEKIINKDIFKFTLIDNNENKKYKISLKDDIYSLVENNKYIKVIPSLEMNKDLDIKLILNIHGNNLNITNTYDTTINTSNYISSKYIINYYVPYIVLIILIIVLIALIIKLKMSG